MKWYTYRNSLRKSEVINACRCGTMVPLSDVVYSAHITLNYLRHVVYRCSAQCFCLCFIFFCKCSEWTAVFIVCFSVHMHTVRFAFLLSALRKHLTITNSRKQWLAQSLPVSNACYCRLLTWTEALSVRTSALLYRWNWLSSSSHRPRKRRYCSSKLSNGRR